MGEEGTLTPEGLRASIGWGSRLQGIFTRPSGMNRCPLRPDSLVLAYSGLF